MIHRKHNTLLWQRPDLTRSVKPKIDQSITECPVMVGGSCERKKTTKHSLDVENEEKREKEKIDL
ncbi:hypothetical protein BLOT_004540 [Blomia tropicalis]|nr:hypothetical protein BLOT_004540 [Blomia tropicalis]